MTRDWWYLEEDEDFPDVTDENDTFYPDPHEPWPYDDPEADYIYDPFRYSRED